MKIGLTVSLAMMGLFCLIFAFASASAAAPELVDDFDRAEPGSIDMQGWADCQGFLLERWNVQDAGPLRADSTWARVVEEGFFTTPPRLGDMEITSPIILGDGPCLRLTNRGPDGQVAGSYATMCLGDPAAMAQTGTLYMVFKADGPTETLLGLNDLPPGYLSDVPGDPADPFDAFQGFENHDRQAALISLTAGEPLRIYDGLLGDFRSVDAGVTAGQWYELWIFVDAPNRRCRFFLAAMGRSPQALANPGGGDWFAWRDVQAQAVTNLKWFVGAAESRGLPVETNVWVDTIASSPTFTTESVRPIVEIWPVMDISYFVTLKQHYGQGPGMTWDQGDYNSDGYVDIQDFVVLKRHYGQ